MHLNQLRYFVTVASARSFTQAAEYHYITQTAITQQIKALEDSVGLKLIDRKKRPIELTPAGKVFYQEAKAILMRVDDALSKAHEASSGAVGTIRIGYEKGYERSELSDRLREFHRSYPNIVFSCLRENTDELAQRLMANELDIIFAWDSAELRRNESIDYRLALRSPLVAALYATHPLAVRASLSRSDLRDETILFMTPSGSGDSFADLHYMHLYEKAGYQPKLLLKSSDVESVLIMVAAEQGISVIPSYCVEKLTNAEHLCFVPLEGSDEAEEIFMLWKKAHNNSALGCFLDFCGSTWLQRQS